MRGCSSKQVGGATPLASSNVGGTEINVPHGTSADQLDNLKASSANFLNLQKLASAGNPVPTTSPTPINIATGTNVQGGGYKSKHRRHRYKKSIGRRGRSRRFRGSRK